MTVSTSKTVSCICCNRMSHFIFCWHI